MNVKQKLQGDFDRGTVLARHRIGDIEIVEYEATRDKSFGKAIPPMVLFHAYIVGKDTNHSYGSLDQALVGSIAQKYDGINTRADTYFWKAIH